jgi:hypothetical protein
VTIEQRGGKGEEGRGGERAARKKKEGKTGEKRQERRGRGCERWYRNEMMSPVLTKDMVRRASSFGTGNRCLCSRKSE